MPQILHIKWFTFNTCFPPGSLESGGCPWRQRLSLGTAPDHEPWTLRVRRASLVGTASYMFPSPARRRGSWAHPEWPEACGRCPPDLAHGPFPFVACPSGFFFFAVIGLSREEDCVRGQSCEPRSRGWFGGPRT